MIPAEYDFTIYQGCTFEKTFQWMVRTYPTPGNTKVFIDTPVDLTGYTFRSQFRTKLKDPTVLLELTLENGKIVPVDLVLGTIKFVLTAEETAALTFNSAVYDVEFVQGARVIRPFRGTVTLDKEITRPPVVTP